MGLTIIICCGLYPLGVSSIGKVFFSFQANGSLLRGPDGSIVGSKFIAQPFSKDEYFQPRPSAASYDASASVSCCATGSGLDPQITLANAGFQLDRIARSGLTTPSAMRRRSGMRSKRSCNIKLRRRLGDWLARPGQRPGS